MAAPVPSGRFARKVAVITGGASGIGRSTALAFAREGADVAISDIHEGRLAETYAELLELGVRAVALRADVTSDDDWERLATEVHDELGTPDIVMLNAGISVLGPPDLVPLQDWRANMEVNFFGVLRGVQVFVPELRSRRSGHVVITASVAGRYAYSYDAGPYIASKFAVYGLAENLALYLRPQGVDVTVLCPGLVATNLGETARFSGLEDPSGWTYFPRHMLRAISPDEVGEIVLDAVEQKKFLVYTHPEDEELLGRRGLDVDAAIVAQLAVQPDPAPPQQASPQHAPPT
jgi:NAD(P)-dependent dehydrogenase (short-subunit alcohol dehydrogenase family)